MCIYIPGEGTEMLVAVRLPVLVPAKLHLQGLFLGPEPVLGSPSPDSTEEKRTIRVLVVDDVSSNMKLLERSLVKYFNIWKSANSTSNWKIEITTVRDGHLAVAIALGVPSDLVLAHLDAGKLPFNTSIRSVFLLIYKCIYSFQYLDPFESFHKCK